MTCMPVLQDPILMRLLLAKNHPVLEIITSFLHLSVCRMGFIIPFLLFILFWSLKDKRKRFKPHLFQKALFEQLYNLLNTIFKNYLWVHMIILDNDLGVTFYQLIDINVHVFVYFCDQVFC